MYLNGSDVPPPPSTQTQTHMEPQLHIDLLAHTETHAETRTQTLRDIQETQTHTWHVDTSYRSANDQPKPPSGHPEC